MPIGLGLAMYVELNLQRLAVLVLDLKMCDNTLWNISDSSAMTVVQRDSLFI